MSDFHAKHFSSEPTDYFAAHFLGPGEGVAADTEAEQDDAEDDGLGYYADGVKRTLTEEQIAIFRHSEVETLLRERRRAEESRAAREEHTLIPANEGKHKNSQGQKRRRSNFKRNSSKPDLRKRTWDKVDTGLETLDYEEDVAEHSSKRNAGSQRRTISYDDM